MTTPLDGQKFWDKIAPKYASRPIKDVAAYEAMLETVRQLLRPSDKILELGCGTGGTALLLAEGVEHVTATDVSSKMIEIARAKLGPNAPGNIEFRQADAAEPIAKSYFDVIFATSLLHLVSDLPLVLDRAFTQIRPGGLLITKTVCLKHSSAPVRAMVRVMTWLGFAPSVIMLSLDDLKKEIQRAGFVVERFEYFARNQLSPFIVAHRPFE